MGNPRQIVLFTTSRSLADTAAERGATLHDLSIASEPAPELARATIS